MVVRISLFSLLSWSLILFACHSEESNEQPSHSEEEQTSSGMELDNKRKINCSNPALLPIGTDIGSAFKAFYLTGQIDKMIELTSSNFIDSVGLDQLRNNYKRLNFGFDMSFYGMNQEDSLYFLNYKCEINATKVKKTLKVCIENDSAKIIPFNPSKGDIFMD